MSTSPNNLPNDYPRYYETQNDLLVTVHDAAGNGSVFDGEKTWALQDVPAQNRPVLEGFGAQRLSVSEAAALKRGLVAAANRRRAPQPGGQASSPLQSGSRAA